MVIKNIFYWFFIFVIYIVILSMIMKKKILLNICFVLGKGDCVYFSRISVFYVE